MTQTAKVRQVFLRTEVRSQNHAIIQDRNPTLMTSKWKFEKERERARDQASLHMVYM
jgi:hypothetical protein